MRGQWVGSSCTIVGHTNSEWTLAGTYIYVRFGEGYVSMMMTSLIATAAINIVQICTFKSNGFIAA